MMDFAGMNEILDELLDEFDHPLININKLYRMEIKMI